MLSRDERDVNPVSTRCCTESTQGNMLPSCIHLSTPSVGSQHNAGVRCISVRSYFFLSSADVVLLELGVSSYLHRTCLCSSSCSNRRHCHLSTDSWSCLWFPQWNWGWDYKVSHVHSSVMHNISNNYCCGISESWNLIGPNQALRHLISWL